MKRNKILLSILTIILFCSTATMAVPLLYSFNVGELSPLIKYRIDQAAYESGCQRLENIIILPQGAAIRRPGTKYISATKNNGQVRLLPFEYSTTDTYILEFGNQYIRFYRNGGQILDANENTYEILTSPYTTSQLRNIQFVQSNDVMYLVHPDVFPQKLSRYGHTNWTIGDVNFVKGPFLDENTTDTTITPSGVTGNISLVASVDVWDANHIDSLWQITYLLDSNSVKGSFKSDGNSSSIKVQLGRNWEFVTHGIWSGQILLEKSYDDGSTWNQEYTFDSNDDDNRQIAGEEEEDDAIYRTRMKSYTGGKCTYSFIIYTFRLKGIVRITGVTNGKNATATVINELGGTTATKDWAEGAWNDKRGYPRSITSFQQRLILAGSYSEPTTLWISVSADYENMDVGTAKDSDAIVYTVASARQNPILWLTDLDTIIAGTNGGIIQVGVMRSYEPLTASNITSRRQIQYGSVNIQPVSIGENLLFVERDSRKVSEMAYKLEADGYIATDLTILASHIVEPNIIEMAVQRRPTPILWCSRGDGMPIGMSYQKQQKVIAWHRHPLTNGFVESIATIPHGIEDEVWFSIKRTINSNTVRYIEQMQPQDWGDDQNDVFFVDCGATYNGSATTDINGLGYLEGQTVSVFADGGYYQTATVHSGKITLSQAVSRANVGLPYTSLLETMPIEVKDDAGYTIGRTKRIYEVFIGFYKTLDCEYGYTGGTMYPVRTQDALGGLAGGAPTLFTGWRNLPFHGTNDKEVSVILRQARPYPMSVLVIAPRLQYGD